MATTEEAVTVEAMTEEVVTAVVMAAAAAAVVAVVAAPSFTSEASALTPAKKPWSRSSPSEPCLHSLGPQHQTSAFISLPSKYFLFMFICRYGRISDAFVPSDRENPGRNRGFGFVTFEDASSAQVSRRPPTNSLLH